MTEEEAKTKWCPFVRAVQGEKLSERASTVSAPQPSFNRVGLGPAEYITPDACRCIASACMAWRWDKGYRDFLDQQNGDVSTSTVNGHCGLAHP